MTTDALLLADEAATQRRAARTSAFDARGCPVATGSRAAIDHAESALRRMVAFEGDPLADLDAAIAADPRWPLAHVMKANGLFSLSEHGFGLLGKACLQQAADLCAAGAGNERERRHVAATTLCAAGDWQGACEAWERILIDQPQDLVALHAAHLFDFYRGDARNLQRRVTRVLPAWSAAMPLYGYVLGMHAFGLEECNLYAQALDAGHAALALEPGDAWAAHAIAHVHEMRGEVEQGVAWIEARSADWAADNAFVYHNWWHLALFRLERLDTAAALKLFDERVAPGAQTALQRIDITAMLWRLRLLGVDVGDRWAASAAAWTAQPGDAGYYAFNDLHAVLALIGAGDVQGAAQVVEAVEVRSREASTLGMMAGEVGLPLLRAMLDYGRGRYAQAADALWAVRDRSFRFGGSHAQRDLIDQTLLDAAIRGGQARLARHLLNERLLAKSHSPLTAHWARRLG